MKFEEVINIVEEIKEVKDGEGCLCVDIDDCILQADSSSIGVWKEKPGEKPVRLSSEQYAKDPDAATHKEWFNYKEFRDPEKVYNSIINGTPLLRQLRLLDAHVRANYHIAFLTARGLQDVVDKALRAFLKYKDSNGNLVPIGDKLKSDISAAVNDMKWVEAYPTAGDPEKKAMVLKNLCKKYKKVKFVDDDLKNLQYARSLKLPNLQVIQASNAPIIEDVLEEEISKKVTKKIDKLEKLAEKFNIQSRRANAKMMVYLRSKEGKELSESKREKLSKIALQLNKAQQELKNVKELKKFNDKSSPKSKEDARKLEKEITEIIRETKKQIKDSMDDPIIKTILRDIGVLSIFIGLPSILSAILSDGIPTLGLVGVAVGVSDIGVAHLNRKDARDRALKNQREMKYFSKKESEKEFKEN